MKKKTGKTWKLSPEEFCPIRQTIGLLGKRWTMLIINETYHSRGKRLSFVELRRRLGDVSAKVLSQRLKEMADDGLLRRRASAETTPVRVYYTLTSKGRDACEIIDAFKEYGLRWGANKTFDCTNMDCELCAKKRAGEAAPSP